MDAHERSHGTLDKRREEFYAPPAARPSRTWRRRWPPAASASTASRRTRCTQPADDPEATSLARMLEAARQAGGAATASASCSFRSTCSNRARRGAQPRPPDGSRTVLDVARRRRGRRAREPSAQRHGRRGLIRLADVPEPGAGRGVGSPAGQPWPSWRRSIARTIAAQLQTAGRQRRRPSSSSAGRTDLRGAGRRTCDSLEHWDQLEGQRIVPRVRGGPEGARPGLDRPARRGLAGVARALPAGAAHAAGRGRAAGPPRAARGS